MITFREFELREIALPLREPFRISSGVVSTRRIVLLRIADGDGHVVWSECVAGGIPNYSPETIDTAWLAIRDWIAPRILHHRFETPSEVRPHLEHDFRGHWMAKAAVEMAAWCMAAELRQTSLATVLGGTRTRVEVGISLGIQDRPEDLADKAAGALAQGYRKVKMKVMPNRDVAYVRAVRECLGADAPLMVDANNAYTLNDIDVLRQLDAFGLMMIEQPLAWDDLVRHAELQRHIQTAICLDESITSVDRVEDMVQLGSGRIVNIKPGRVGGFQQSLAIHDLCQHHAIPVWCGGMLESGIGRAYNVALASLPNFAIPGDISPSARYWERDIVTPEWTMSGDGTTAVPRDQPGLGVTIDVDRIDDLTMRHEAV